MHCRFCPDCDLLIAHQNELEAQLAAHMSEHAPSVIGNKYIVIGTMERSAWREGMREPKQLADMLKYIADFKEALSFTVRLAGWYPTEEKRLSRLERDCCQKAVSTCSRKFSKLR